MDTGYANLIDDDVRRRVLRETREVLGRQPFVAGAFVGDTPGSPFAFRDLLPADRLDQLGGGHAGDLFSRMG